MSYRCTSIERGSQREQDRREKEASSSDQRLRHSQESKSIDAGKGGRKTVDCDSERGRGGGSCIALIPRETVMCPLCSSDDVCVSGSGVIFGWCLTHGQGHQLCSRHLHPSAPKVTTWPIAAIRTGKRGTDSSLVGGGSGRD